MSFWKRFYYGMPEPGKFYEAAEGGSAAGSGSGDGGGAGATAAGDGGGNGAPQNGPATGDGIIPEPQSVLEFLKNAPVISGGQQQPEGGKPPEGAAPQEPEGGKKEGEPQDTPQKIKLGDEEFTIDQIQEFRKAYEEREKWQRNLTQRSQLDRWFQNLPPEKQEAFLARAIADVYAQKDPGELKAPNEPLKLTIEGDDDYEYEIEVKPGTEEYEKLEKHFEQRFMEKYKNVFTELKAHQERLKEFQQEVEQYQRRVGQQKALQFLKSHPELGLQLPNEQVDLEEYLGQIVSSGPTHPHYDAAMRVINLAQIAMQNGWDLEKAYEYMYGDFVKKQQLAKQAEQVARQNQKGVGREGQGKGAPAATDDEKFISRLAGSNPLSDIFAEAEKNLRKL